MVAKSVKWALASLVVFPPAAFGLGLGDVRLLSALNAPLDAEIEVEATPEEMTSLKAQLASRELFTRFGLEYPSSVGTITLTPQTRADGKRVIRLRSAQTVTDPFLTLLVEVNTARERVVREYVMLLDPPVFAPGEQRGAPVAAPSTGVGTREGTIARETPAASDVSPAPSQASDEPALRSSPPVASSDGTSRTVRRGETLSGIASEVATDSSELPAWMLAIYRNNPQAFDGNMNVLRQGAVLRIPDRAAVTSINIADANAEIRRQWSSWRGSAGASAGRASDEPGRLRLVPPAATAGSPTNDAATAALQGRVRELEAQLEESRRLLEARNAELAQLQARLAGVEGQPAPAPEPAAPPPSAAVEEPEPLVDEETEAPLAGEPAVAQEEQPAPAQEAERAPPATAATAPAEEQGGSILDMLKDYWWALAALATVLLGFFGFKAIRARKQNEFDDSLSNLRMAAAGGAEALGRDASGDTLPLRGGSSREDSFLVEESGTHERPRLASDFAPATAPRTVQADETISSETAINLDQGDPLAEADFHMAYGLYDQAADLVRIAISREPNRRDLKLKLLEVFFVWGNREQFLQTARELADTRDEASPGEWEKIVIMGKQLAPDDELFAGGAAPGGSSLGGMDLDLEGGQERVDFDVFGEPQQAVAGGDGIDLDIGSALGEPDASRSGQTVTDANLALHEEAFGADDASTGITREMAQNLRSDNSPTVAYGADLDAPTVEQPAFQPTIRQKVETAMKQSGLAEQTAELAIDDLGLDIGALDDNQGASSDAPTMVAGLDERSRRIMDEAERRSSLSDLDATAIASTGAWNLNGEDLDATMPPQQAPAYRNGNGNGADTSRLAALKADDLDFNFGENGHGHGLNGSGNGLDLDVGTATVADAAFASTQKLSSEDLALPDLEPVTMSEVGTKLDLARAYMDMGDPEGARNILEEVLTEGSIAQKQEAQRLMESLPG